MVEKGGWYTERKAGILAAGLQRSPGTTAVRGCRHSHGCGEVGVCVRNNISRNDPTKVKLLGDEVGKDKVVLSLGRSPGEADVEHTLLIGLTRS